MVVERLHEAVVLVAVEHVQQAVAARRRHEVDAGGVRVGELQTQHLCVVRLDALNLVRQRQVVNANVAGAIAGSEVLAVGTDAHRANAVLLVRLVLVALPAT